MNSFKEKNIQQHYDKFASIYHNMPDDDFFKKISCFGFNENSKVLDVGCGTGKLIYQIAENFNCELLAGIDLSGKEIELAKKIIKEKRLNNCFLKSGNALSIPFEDHMFDFVFSNRVFQLINDIETAFREADRVLKPGGQAYIRIVTSDREDVMPELYVLFKKAWQKYIPERPVPRIFNVLSVKEIENILDAMGIENFQIILEKMSFSLNKEIALRWLPVYNVLAGYWKQNVEECVSKNIDEDMAAEMTNQCSIRGNFKMTGHYLTVSYKKDLNRY